MEGHNENVFHEISKLVEVMEEATAVGKGQPFEYYET